MSGGRATVGAKRGHDHARQAGDVCSVSPEGHALTDVFYFELKHYRSLELNAFLISNKGKLARFWLKTCEEAVKYKREPVLIAKENRLPTLIITKRKHIMNPLPFAQLVVPAPDHMLTRCWIGLLDRTLKTKFSIPE